jgi:hypothetical protein
MAGRVGFMGGSFAGDFLFVPQLKPWGWGFPAVKGIK